MTLFPFQKKIFFAAYKKPSTAGSVDGEITYDIADINEGAGFDQQSGKFRAPEGGTYFFTFSGVTGKPKSSTYVCVYKDGSVHHFISDPNASDNYNNINSSWMMVLSKGSEVYLSVLYGKLYAYSHLAVIFTGNLLKLDNWRHHNCLISKSNFDKNTMVGVNTILISITLEREKNVGKKWSFEILKVFWNKVKMSKKKVGQESCWNRTLESSQSWITKI